MSVKFEFENKTMTALLSGEIDHHTAAEIRESIDRTAEKRLPSVLRLDFGGVTFMDSSGVGLVMGRIRLMKSLGSEVEVLNLTSNAYKVMMMANLGGLAKIEKKVETENEK